MFYLMSIHENFASLILSGEKSVELRRNNIQMHSGDYVAIYATKPTARIVGYFIVDHVVKDDYKTVWKLYKDKACIAYKSYLEYVEGKSTISAIVIKNSIKKSGLTLAEMDLWIPQSYSRIREDQFLKLCKINNLPEENEGGDCDDRKP